LIVCLTHSFFLLPLPPSSSPSSPIHTVLQALLALLERRARRDHLVQLVCKALLVLPVSELGAGSCERWTCRFAAVASLTYCMHAYRTERSRFFLCSSLLAFPVCARSARANLFSPPVPPAPPFPPIALLYRFSWTSGTCWPRRRCWSSGPDRIAGSGGCDGIAGRGGCSRHAWAQRRDGCDGTNRRGGCCGIGGLHGSAGCIGSHGCERRRPCWYVKEEEVVVVVVVVVEEDQTEAGKEGGNDQ
jgi:hypothetical protein